MNKVQSIYTSYINEFISFKRALGFKYMEEARILRRFEIFVMKENMTQVGITKDLFEKWRDLIPNESDNYKYARCVCVNQLSTYLSDNGICSYISRLPRRRTPLLLMYSQDRKLKLYLKPVINLKRIKRE